MILGRTYADGSDADFAAVNALQDKYQIVPLSAYGKPYNYVAPPVNPNPGLQYDRQAAAGHRRDGRLDLFQHDGAADGRGGAAGAGGRADGRAHGQDRVGARQTVRHRQARPGDAGSVKGCAQDRDRQRLLAQQSESGFTRNGWHIPAAAGSYGTNYLARALVAAFGWPANLPQDAVYPYAAEDSTGAKLSGANKYTITFPKGRTPPVDGFWSITMYIIDGGWWFYPNPLNRFTVSMRDKPAFNPDGSLTLYFQNESPGKDKEANWLPAPQGNFILMMRMYWPKQRPPSILPPGRGSWEPPPIMRVA